MKSALLPRSNSADSDTITIVAQEESSGARQPTDSRSVLRPSASDIPTTYQPVDWSSDEGARVDGSARRIAINLAIGGNGWAFFSRVKFLVFACALKVAWIGQLKADC
ncbi:hypothetical protein PR003_g21580 [Phytophthora rubi]|uniref:Uncharacterized protein n=1 Tax=Phytophthora rubi TaxID=129364 RepID=A0A6A4DLE6_9STRA|nr:hypothetical protein PR003_g21580 [Phytophthora rubi]